MNRHDAAKKSLELYWHFCSDRGRQGRSVFVDAAGRCWLIPSDILRTSARPFYVRVEDLWQREAGSYAWGHNLPCLQALAEIALNKHSLVWALIHANGDGSKNDHVSRIFLLAKSIAVGIAIPPILIFSDNRICDGYHRLAASYLAGASWIRVFRVVPNSSGTLIISAEHLNNAFP